MLVVLYYWRRQACTKKSHWGCPSRASEKRREQGVFPLGFTIMDSDQFKNLPTDIKILLGSNPEHRVSGATPASPPDWVSCITGQGVLLRILRCKRVEPSTFRLNVLWVVTIFKIGAVQVQYWTTLCTMNDLLTHKRFMKIGKSDILFSARLSQNLARPC